MTHPSLRDELLILNPIVPDESAATRAGAFEAAVAERTGARHAIAVSSSSAFEIALRATGQRSGTTVLTTSLADSGIVRATIGSGLRPRFADVDAHGQLAPAAVAAHVALYGEPAVVVAAHFAGHPCDVRALAEAAPHAFLIEDAPDGLGAVHADGRPVGAPGKADVTVLGVRSLRAMAPAVLLTDDAKLAARLRVERDGRVEHRLSELHAALGLVQLGRLPALLARRTSVAVRYDEAVAVLTTAEPVAVPPGARSAWAAYPLRVPAWARPALSLQLEACGVGARRPAIPLHRHVYFGRYADVLPAELPATERFASEVVLLPTSTPCEDTDVARVVEVVSAMPTSEIDGARLVG